MNACNTLARTAPPGEWWGSAVRRPPAREWRVRTARPLREGAARPLSGAVR
jgi:hypothetical protein